MNRESHQAPLHLWIVGILSLLWNAMGCFDYLATKLRLDFYMSQFTEAQLEYFYSFPAWLSIFWALGVWGSLLGSLALLLRSRWAVALFAVSLLGMIVSTAYTVLLSNGLEIMGAIQAHPAYNQDIKASIMPIIEAATAKIGAEKSTAAQATGQKLDFDLLVETILAFEGATQ